MIERRCGGKVESCEIRNLRKNDVFRFKDGVGRDIWRIATGDSFFGHAPVDPEYEVWGIGSTVLQE